MTNNRVVGVSFQSLRDTDNISYIIPIPVIAHFLRQYYRSARFETLPGGCEKPAAPQYESVPDVTSVPVYGHPFYHPGFCSLGCYIQEPVNEHLRRRHGLKKSQQGVMIQELLDLAPIQGTLQQNDVLLAVAGTPIANDGTITFRPNERVKFSHLLQMKASGEEVPLRVFRDGAELDLSIPAAVTPQLVKSHLYNPYFDQKPKYVMCGGLVFTPLTMPFLMEWNEWYTNSPRNLINLALWGQQTTQRREIVILDQVLPHEVNKGYQADQFQNRVVRRVNGTEVRDMRHFHELLCTPSGHDEYACLELVLHESTMSLVLDTAKAAEADKDISRIYNVPSTTQL